MFLNKGKEMKEDDLEDNKDYDLLIAANKELAEENKKIKELLEGLYPIFMNAKNLILSVGLTLDRKTLIGFSITEFEKLRQSIIDYEAKRSK